MSALPPRGPGPADRAWKTRKAWEGLGLDAERPGLREGPEVA